MWIFKGLLFLVLLFVLVYFFIDNSDHSVDIDVYGRTYLDVSVYWIVVASFLLGFATSFVIAGFREFRFRRDVSRLKRTVKTRDKEIADLRTMALHEPDEVAAAPVRTGKSLEKGAARE
ncbi:LapA family protein [bacterium]|nr:LapA family protein [bacterium]